MSKDKTVQAYLDTVAAQIRWKRARAMVTWELARHLEDQRSAFAAAGYANAEQLAVEEMGDPVSVGVDLDCIHRPKPQWGLLALTILLALTGVLLRIGLTASWGPMTWRRSPPKPCSPLDWAARPFWPDIFWIMPAWGAMAKASISLRWRWA